MNLRLHFGTCLVAAFTFTFACATGCRSAPEPKPAGPPPQLSQQELSISEQGLTDFTVRFEGRVTSAEPIQLEKARFELVVDGQVVKRGEVPVSVAAESGANGTAVFSFEQSSRYVGSAEDLKDMDSRGGSLLVALRGTVLASQSGRSTEVAFAKSREVRVPRLPHVRLKEIDAARYAADEASATFYLSVDNPNPFPLKLSGLDYQVTIAGKSVAEGTRGSGEKVSPSSAGVFEVQVAVNQEGFGPDAAKLIKTLKLPYSVTGNLKSDLLNEPFELTGTIKLNASK